VFKSPRIPRNSSGFTLLELLITGVIISILAATAIPAFSVWLPGYRLKTATRDLFSNLQLAKLTAIKTNQSTSVSFTASQAQYTVSGVNKTVSLDDYGSGVKFDDPTHSETFPASPITFNSTGMLGTLGTPSVYLSNGNNSAYYKIECVSTGAIRMEKWSGSGWE